MRSARQTYGRTVHGGLWHLTLEVVRGSQGGKKVNLKRPLHPFILRAFNGLRDDFASVTLSKQDPWVGEGGSDKLLHLIPDRELRENLRKKWTSDPYRSSTKKWSDIDEVAKSGVSKVIYALCTATRAKF